MSLNENEIIKSIAQFKIPGWSNLTTGQIKITKIR